MTTSGSFGKDEHTGVTGNSLNVHQLYTIRFRRMNNKQTWVGRDLFAGQTAGSTRCWFDIEHSSGMLIVSTKRDKQENRHL